MKKFNYFSIFLSSFMIFFGIFMIPSLYCTTDFEYFVFGKALQNILLLIEKLEVQNTNTKI